MPPTDTASVTALCRNHSDSGWHLFEHCSELIVAHAPEQVNAVLERVEAASAAGQYALGFVAYEAAAGVDAALATKAAAGPLACFALFSGYRDIADLSACPGHESGSDSDSSPPRTASVLAPRFGKANFLSALQSINAYLEAGDCYQVNFTEPLAGTVAANPVALFEQLYAAQPSPLSVLLMTDDFAVLSVSPELFFSLDGEQIRMQPMKGTRPRGETPELDQSLRDELIRSDKERAENLMIVDMVRNDLGRIAATGSVSAAPLFELMELPTVWQLVSTVSARTGAGLAELFAALFPCASITGAPKRRAMAIIDQLERAPRGVYTGAIGRLLPGRDWRFSVGIRTLFLERATGSAHYGVGAGIVWGHEPEAEWQELLAKAKILQAAAPDFELFETLRYDSPQGVVNQALHIERLAHSAAHFGFTFSPDQATAMLTEFSAQDSARLRLRLAYNGALELDVFALPAAKERIELQLSSRPVSSADPFLRHKTSHRAEYESQRQSHPQGDDVQLWNERGELTECTIFNLLIELDGRVLTPALSSGLLPGVQRRVLLDSGEVEEAVVHRDDLQRATRLWVCNSLRGCIPAVVIG